MAGFAEGVMSGMGIDFGEAFEGGPRGSFGDGDVGIVGMERLAMRGIYDADGQAYGEEREERSDFGFGEREGALVGGENGAGRGERIVFTEYGVGSGDGGFGYGGGVMHVAEIDEADDAARLRLRWRD